MTSPHRVGVAGTGSYVPERVVPNSWFEDVVDTSDEWIVQRTGFRGRRWVAKGEATASMSTVAARRALEQAKIDPAEVDLIVLATLTPDHLLPSCSSRVQHDLGATRAGIMDLNSACTGFMTATATARAFIASGQARTVVAIGAETLSAFLDLEDRASCILFGDGAGATVFTRLEDAGGRGELLETTLGAAGSGYDFIHMQGGGSLMPPTVESVNARRHFIGVRGREVYKFAVTRMSSIIEELLAGHDREELGLIVPHQVNMRIIESALQRLDIPMDKCMINIDKYGNTSAATVPIAFDEAAREGRLEPGKLVVTCAFGAGLTWGGSLMRW